MAPVSNPTPEAASQKPVLRRAKASEVDLHRAAIAVEASVPADVVAHDCPLAEIAAMKPTTNTELEQFEVWVR